MRTNYVLDSLISELDNALRIVFPPIKRISSRESPAISIKETALNSQEKKHIAGLMRVNHAGEVCAQALYQGQARTAQIAEIRNQMTQAAQEEIDHLSWCEQRLSELGAKPSLLNPIWYAGSFLLGALAGMAGDKISLGFVAETERQVTSHLQKHLYKIPTGDNKTRAILQQMKEDETHHAEQALTAGAIELPFLIKQLMGLVSQVMTKSSYYL